MKEQKEGKTNFLTQSIVYIRRVKNDDYKNKINEAYQRHFHIVAICCGKTLSLVFAKALNH